MTDPVTPAEAAAADAIDANLAVTQNANNADLAGGVVPEALSPEETVASLEAKLAAIKALKALAAGQGIPHDHPVPAAQVHQAVDAPVRHTPSQPVPEQPQGVVQKAVSPSAKLAEKLAAIPPGTKPVKRKYAYQRNR